MKDQNRVWTHIYERTQGTAGGSTFVTKQTEAPQIGLESTTLRLTVTLEDFKHKTVF